MQFLIFISILHSPLTETYWKKSRKIGFPKLVTSVYFQKGLNPQIVENREIHRNLYKNRRVKLMRVFGFYVASYTGNKIIWVYKTQNDYSNKLQSGFRPFLEINWSDQFRETIFLDFKYLIDKLRVFNCINSTTPVPYEKFLFSVFNH